MSQKWLISASAPTFVLSKSADRILDKLAKTRGISRSQVLERLIHEESERGNKKTKW